MSEPPVTIIESRPASLWRRIGSAWRFRSYYPVLLREITTRKVKNTLLGVWWLILRPLVPTVIAVVAFTYFVRVDTGGLPYGLFFLPAFIVWTLFHGTITFMARTLMWTRGLMKKMYMPKLLVPAASIGPPAIELAITTSAFLFLVAFYYFKDGQLDIEVGWRMLLFFPCVALSLALAMAIGAVISVIALLMRDIIFSIGWIIQMLMFVTPVLYPASSIPEETRWAFFAFNPMAAIIETNRWALTGFGEFPALWFAISVVETIVIVLLCLTFFSRAETYLSDIV